MEIMCAKLKLKNRVQEGYIHICLRGNRKQNVFYDNSDRYEFLVKLESASVEYKTNILEFALMDNHAHILVYTPNLTKFMRSFLISYVRWYNLKYTTTGNLFQRPFLSVSKRKLEWIIETALYILQNPVKANICSHPCDYRWSSCRCHFKQFNSFTKHITVDTSLIDSHFVSEKNFYRILGEKIVSRCELTEKGQVNPVRVPDCEVIDQCNKILNNRFSNKKVSELSRVEKSELIKYLNNNTLATFRQIASITHENFKWVIQQCKVNE